jgi:DNA-binding GntR family transcriptional regulator
MNTVCKRIAMAPLKRENISEQLTSIIAGQIIRDELKSGEVISETGISKAFEVSRSPVRDALHRLEQIRLVERTPRGNYQVSVLTTDLIENLYDTANILFQYAFSKAAKKATPEDIRVMKKQLDKLEESITSKNLILYLSSVTRLATIILKTAGNPIVERLALELMPMAERVQWSSINSVPDQLQTVVNHLGRGVAHISSRNSKAAARAFRDFSTAHIEVVFNHMR